jgi:hypothetical protein
MAKDIARRGALRKAVAEREAPLSRLVRLARGPVSQEKFAKWLGISQESLSRYELGRVPPSSVVIAKCWEAFEGRRDTAAPAASELAHRIRQVSGAEHVAVREAIARLIDMSIGRARPGRRARQPAVTGKARQRTSRIA